MFFRHKYNMVMKEALGRYPGTRPMLFELTNALHTICTNKEEATQLFVHARFKTTDTTFEKCLHGIKAKPFSAWVSPVTGWAEVIAKIGFDEFDFTKAWEPGHKIFGTTNAAGYRDETDFVTAHLKPNISAKFYLDMAWMILDFDDLTCEPLHLAIGEDQAIVDFNESIKLVIESDNKILSVMPNYKKPDISIFTKTFAETYHVTPKIGEAKVIA